MPNYNQQGTPSPSEAGTTRPSSAPEPLNIRGAQEHPFRLTQEAATCGGGQPAAVRERIRVYSEALSAVVHVATDDADVTGWEGEIVYRESDLPLLEGLSRDQLRAVHACRSSARVADEEGSPHYWGICEGDNTGWDEPVTLTSVGYVPGMGEYLPRYYYTTRKGDSRRNREKLEREAPAVAAQKGLVYRAFYEQSMMRRQSALTLVGSLRERIQHAEPGWHTFPWRSPCRFYHLLVREAPGTCVVLKVVGAALKIPAVMRTQADCLGPLINIHLAVGEKCVEQVQVPGLSGPVTEALLGLIVNRIRILLRAQELLRPGDNMYDATGTLLGDDVPESDPAAGNGGNGIRTWLRLQNISPTRV